jgi:ribosomal protein S18 acetylase RimI-like enzyme
MLDNPIWHSLGTTHAGFSEGLGDARRFDPAVSPLCGLRDGTEDSWAALEALVAPGGRAGLFVAGVPHRPAWASLHEGPLLQMVQEAPGPQVPAVDFVELGADDAPEMLRLAELTKPGPFSLRTRELGTFLGVRSGKRLAAMAGERLRLPGWTEISGVCTHPEQLGKGYAGALMSELARRIRARGETPLLHVRGDNERAIGLYEKLGFCRRGLSRYAILGRR